MVERTFIRPPSGQLGPVTPSQRQATIADSPVAGKYETAIDRESAYEKLHKKAAANAQVQQQAAQDKADAKAARAAPRERESATDKFVKSVAVSVGRQVARSIGTALVRGILGSLTRR